MKSCYLLPSFLKNTLLLFCIAAAANSCLDPYAPTQLTENPDYLVVEGFISSGSHSLIRLSRTSSVSDTFDVNLEENASLAIEGKSGFNLEMMGNMGFYFTPPTDLDPTDEYRLRIVTANGNLYYSEYVPLKQTPPIDSISWERTENAVNIYVNTHDPTNSTRYYKWDYEETWEYNVPFISRFDYINGKIVPSTEPKPNNCWQHHISSSIIIGSSDKHSQDIIYKQPVSVVRRGTPKISSKYSILVRQQALSREAYEYYQQMKKNTEQTGSFFDPLPTEVRGNVYNEANPNELVIGYVSAGRVQEKRIYITNEQVRPWGYGLNCTVVEVQPGEYDGIFAGGNYLPLYIDKFTGAAYAAPRHCFDCSRVASPIRPDFWE